MPAEPPPGPGRSVRRRAARRRARQDAAPVAGRPFRPRSDGAATAGTAPAAHGVSIDTLVAGRADRSAIRRVAPAPARRRRRRSALAMTNWPRLSSSTGVATSRQTVASGSSASTPACRSLLVEQVGIGQRQGAADPAAPAEYLLDPVARRLGDRPAPLQVATLLADQRFDQAGHHLQVLAVGDFQVLPRNRWRRRPRRKSPSSARRSLHAEQAGAEHRLVARDHGQPVTGDLRRLRACPGRATPGP